MTANRLFKAESWPAFFYHVETWKLDGPFVTVVPGEDEKRSTAGLMNDLCAGNIYTIRDLVERYSLISLTDSGLMTLQDIEAILGEVVEESTVPYLHIEKQRQGYIRALAGFIDNFRRTSLLNLEEAFAAMQVNKPGFREKDLVQIYNKYLQLLVVRGHDFRSALEHFSNLVNPDNITGLLNLPRGTRFVFFGFSFLNPLEIIFAGKVFENAPGSAFLMCFDPDASEQAQRVQQSLKPLFEMAGPWETQELANDFYGDGGRNYNDLARALFKDSSPGEGFDLPGVLIRTANNRHAEISAWATQIRELLDSGVDPDQIKVVLPTYDLYCTIIAEVFPEYGIPYYFDRGTPLLRYPLATLVYNLVCQGIVANPFTLREAIFSSPYVSFELEANFSELIEFQRSAGTKLIAEERLKKMIGSQQSIPLELDYTYISRMRREAYLRLKPAAGTGQLEVLKRYLEEHSRDGTGEDDGETLKCLLQLYTLEQAGKALTLGHSRMSNEEFRQGVQRLLQQFRVEENINLNGRLPFECNNKGAVVEAVEERDRRILQQILDILDALAGGSVNADGGAGVLEAEMPVERSRTDLARLFAGLIEQARFETCFPPGSEGLKISVEPVQQGHYKLLDHLFICGLVDGEFPSREEFNFLQPLNEGLGLGLAYTSVDHARNHLYHLIRSTGKALYLSSPLTHNGRMLPASPFVLELKKLISLQEEGGSEKEENRFHPLYCKREQLIEIGKNVDSNYENILPLLRKIGKGDKTELQLIFDIMRFDGLTLSTERFSEFDGLFFLSSSNREKGKEIVSELLLSLLEKITVTTDVLERYAACPLRFFLDDLLGLKKEDDYEPDTTERGMLVRSLLKKYTGAAVKVGQIPGDAPNIFKQWIETYFAEQDESDKDAFESRFQKQLLAGLDGTKTGRTGLFAAFLSLEKDFLDYFVPFMAILQGSVNLRSSHEVPVEIDRIELAGSIGMLVLYRYSYGDTGDVSKMLRGLHFKLPFALLFLIDYVKANLPEKNVGAAGTYLVKSPKAIRRGGYLGREAVRTKRRADCCEETPLFSGQREGFFEETDFEDKLEQIRQKAEIIISRIKNGIFHLPLCVEADQSCANCTFIRICRKEQLRLDRLWFMLRKDPHMHVVVPPAKKY